MGRYAGTVERCWRYPIKSVGGEIVESFEVEARGVVGDRLYAVRDSDGKLGSGKDSRRFRRMDGLAELSSRYRDGSLELLDPSGAVVADPSSYMRDFLGRPAVSIARESDVKHFDEEPLNLLSTASLAWMAEAVPGTPVDERRFRPNLLIRTPPQTPAFVEDDWSGRSASIGEVVIEFLHACERCRMTSMAQKDLPDDAGILRTIAGRHDNRLAVFAKVVEPGVVRVGDALTLR